MTIKPACRLCAKAGVLLSLLWCSFGVQAETISVRADQWFPVNGHPDAARPGFGIEILNEVWRSPDYRIDYRLMPWSRSLEMVRSGQHDCVIGAFVTDAPDFRFPREPLAFDSAAVYVSRGSSLEYNGLDSLESVRLGVIGSYSYGAAFDDWLARHADSKTVEVMKGSDALERNIRKLLSGRLDALVESPLVMESKLKKMNLSERIEHLAPVSDPMPMFVACSPVLDARPWLDAFDKGMVHLRESGQLEAIYRRYGIDAARQLELRRRWSGRAAESAE